MSITRGELKWICSVFKSPRVEGIKRGELIAPVGLTSHHHRSNTPPPASTAPTQPTGCVDGWRGGGYAGPLLLPLLLLRRLFNID